MKILFYGDSITDMGRARDANAPNVASYGSGYPFFVAGDLLKEDPKNYELINRGISGNRVVDLYARIKIDAWNLEPDVFSILIGINDIWHEIGQKNGVELDRFENIYRLLIEETKARLPKTKIMLMEPFVLHGTATDNAYEQFCEVYKYAAVVKKLAEEYDLIFVPLQETLTKAAEENGPKPYLYDGVHPGVAGARLIADEWLKAFRENVKG